MRIAKIFLPSFWGLAIAVTLVAGLALTSGAIAAPSEPVASLYVDPDANAASHDVPLQVVPTPIMVTTFVDEYNSNGNCSLREAIQAANIDMVVDSCPAGVGDDVITLPAGIYVITRSGSDDTNMNGDFDITSNIVFVGNGPDNTIVRSAVADRVFHVSNAGLTISFMNLM